MMRARGDSRERLLLGGVALFTAAMIAMPRDEVRYDRCVRADAHRVAASAAFDEGRLLRARREAQAVEAMCARAAPALRDLELAAMVGLGECLDARDLARVMGVEAPPCDEPKPHELASDALAALHAGDRRKAWQLFERALGFNPEFKAGERIALTGDAARFGHHVLVCMSDGVVLLDLESDMPAFVRRDGYERCMLSPSRMDAYVNGHMVDAVHDVDLWSTDGRGVMFSSDGAFFLEGKNGTLRLRNAQTGEMLGTFADATTYGVYAIGRTFQWERRDGADDEWIELAVDPPSLKRSAFVDAKSAANDGRHRAVVDAARSAIVITNLATHAEVVIPSQTVHVERMAFTPDGKSLITHSYGSTRSVDVATGEELILEGVGHGRRLDAPHDVTTQPWTSSITVADGARKREIRLDEIPITTAHEAFSVLHAAAGDAALPRDLEAHVVASRLTLTRDDHELTIRAFPRGRLFIESEGLFDVVGELPVKCFAHNDSEPLPTEACDPRRTAGLLAAFLAR
jgi:hypothetical protein